ncbi:Cell division cycle 5-like protein, partial [Drosera capensis]
ASLQKRRELKAAGIDIRHRKRKRKGIDYNTEIPFEKRPPPGFYDIADEGRPVEQPKFPTTIDELEGERRVDKEARLRKQDIARNKIAQRQDAPAAIMQANKLNDPETVRKRSKLMLPPPQISDHELEEIAKMGYAGDLLAGTDELADGSVATRALLGNYSRTPRQGMTPLRTPQRTPAGKGDAIMMEAENLARLRESRTPLLGGDNPELHPSDFSGVTPKKREIQTPSPMLTPSATPGATPSATPGGAGTPRIGMTPSRDGYSFGITPKGTPLRDELCINEEMDVLDTAKLELRRRAELKKNVRSGLTNLPQPKNDYEIDLRAMPEDEKEPEETIEEDMSDRLARKKAEEEARLQALLRKRSKVLQRELPRPPAASVEFIRNSLIKTDEDKSSFVPPTPIEQADELIRKELLNLLEHDNAKYPLDEKAEKEKKKGVKHHANGKVGWSVPVIEDFEEDELKEAESLIKEDAEYVRLAMGHENESLDDFVEAHRLCLTDVMYIPTRNAYFLSSVAAYVEKLAALQNEFENVKNKMDDDTKKAVRLEQKIKVLTQGYQNRANNLASQIEATFKQMVTAGTELDCFLALQKQENLAASYRANSLREDVQKQKELEKTLQKRYGDLLAEIERTKHLMEESRVQARRMEELEAANRSKESALATETPDNVLNTESVEPPSSRGVDSSHDVTTTMMLDSVEGSDKLTSEQDMVTAPSETHVLSEAPSQVSLDNENTTAHVPSGITSSEGIDLDPAVTDSTHDTVVEMGVDNSLNTEFKADLSFTDGTNVNPEEGNNPREGADVKEVVQVIDDAGHRNHVEPDPDSEATMSNVEEVVQEGKTAEGMLSRDGTELLEIQSLVSD